MSPPKGSRQHFLSFNYDDLFTAQEKAGIEYDMSMGYPDRAGPRAGFSYPYFPYCLADDRPYNVVEISLCLMDVTLRSYMSLSTDETWEHISGELSSLRGKGGSVSCVWHPIVFGGARDPGMAGLYWRMVEEVKDTNGLATDGLVVNAHWREGRRAMKVSRSLEQVRRMSEQNPISIHVSSQRPLVVRSVRLHLWICSCPVY